MDKSNDELKINEIIVANLPEKISIDFKLEKFREIDKGFMKNGSDKYLLLKPYDKVSESMFITLFLNLDRISDVFKYIEKYLGIVRLIDTKFDKGFEGKIDFWVEDTCYSLVSADGFTIDIKEGI